ncbi:MAG: YeeE/YedE thiosulfate transporter family protein [Saprospiraceae bacterium]|nr:YeeE/YedE family protein [Saprospiraceae bacterium]MBP7644093.1 YeeE/YedE family protein [Saprospiraceae bacterium]
MDFLHQPWHWSIAGLIIGLTVPALLIVDNRRFGISMTLKHLCAMCVPMNIKFFDYDWKAYKWLFIFVIGTILGGFIGNVFFKNPESMVVAEQTKTFLANYGITDFSNLMPSEIFSVEEIFSLKGLVFLAIGGFLIGFGTRYADGCTSGHSIFGLATLQWPSLVATICFMIGGIFCTHFILPFILKTVMP